jgi:cytochrome c nitrite reductase small subunit
MSRTWLLAPVLGGVLMGLGLYTFVYAKGYSYLTDRPEACANCHVMGDHYRAWTRSSHHAVAACNDCHTPSALVPKYLTKAQNGFWHSFYFTTGRYPDPLRITARNQAITEQACRTCHAELALAIDPAHAAAGPRGLSCVSCHGDVGHLE